ARIIAVMVVQIADRVSRGWPTIVLWRETSAAIQGDMPARVAATSGDDVGQAVAIDIKKVARDVENVMRMIDGIANAGVAADVRGSPGLPGTNCMTGVRKHPPGSGHRADADDLVG